jgi:hypothetical protein
MDLRCRGPLGQATLSGEQCFFRCNLKVEYSISQLCTQRGCQVK